MSIIYVAYLTQRTEANMVGYGLRPALLPDVLDLILVVA